MRTTALTALLIVTAAGIVRLAVARDSSHERTGSVADSQYMSGTRSAVPFQTAPRSSATTRSSPTSPTPSSDAGRSYSRPAEQTVRPPSVSAPAPSRDSGRTFTRTAEQTAREPNVSAPAPSRDSGRTFTRTAEQTAREPNVSAPAPSRDSGRTYTRTAEQTAREPNVSAPAPSRDSGRTYTRTAEQTAREPNVSAPAPSRDSGRMSTRSSSRDSARNARSQTADTSPSIARHDLAPGSTPFVHESMDGRSDSSRTLTRAHTTSPDARHDARPDAFSSAHRPEPSRPEAAGRPEVAERSRYASALSLRSERTGAPGVQPPRSTVSRPIQQSAFWRDQPRMASFPQRHEPHAGRPSFDRPWRYPSVYPLGWGLTWSSHNFLASFTYSSYSPAYTFYGYTPTYAYFGYTPTYACFGYTPAFTYASYSFNSCRDRRYDRYQSCSYNYYGGWRHGWYGGFSYVCNPWPVYSTYYFYDPPPVVTQTETVYITQPAMAAAPAAAAPIAEAPAPTVDGEPAVSNTLAAADQNASADIRTSDLWADYGAGADDFTLDFTSYAEMLDTERVWASYAEIDRAAPFEDDNLNLETAALTAP